MARFKLTLEISSGNLTVVTFNSELALIGVYTTRTCVLARRSVTDIYFSDEAKSELSTVSPPRPRKAYTDIS